MRSSDGYTQNEANGKEMKLLTPRETKRCIRKKGQGLYACLRGHSKQPTEASFVTTAQESVLMWTDHGLPNEWLGVYRRSAVMFAK